MIKFGFITLSGIIFILCLFVLLSNDIDMLEQTIENQDLYIQQLEQEIIRKSINEFDLFPPNESPKLPQDPQTRTWMT